MQMASLSSCTSLALRQMAKQSTYYVWPPARLLHVSAAFSSVPKSSLAKLRKKTGYSLSLCRQALEVNEQDVSRAQEWLKEQALNQGWAKANKLEGRNTAQGLIGVLVRNNIVSMVEVNCETDFVARNAQFHELLNEVTLANLMVAAGVGPEPRKEVDSQALSALTNQKGHSLADLVALNIGQIGERIVARRGVCLGTASSSSSSSSEATTRVAGVTHPSASIHSRDVQYGRYGAAIAYTVEKGGVMPKGQDINSMARQICQHIIGMNPSRVGNIDTFASFEQACLSLEERGVSPREGGQNEEEQSLEEKEDAETSRVDEQAMLATHEELVRQDFLLNPEVKVGRVLLDTGLRVVDFVRYEVGQDLDC